MSQTTHPPDALDQALSAFFKSKMRHPWPAAPVALAATPSSLVPARDHADHRARLTLAASAALLLGTCWLMSGGSQTADRARTAPGVGVPNVLDGATAKTPEAFDTGRKDKAKGTKDPMTGFQPGPITLP